MNLGQKGLEKFVDYINSENIEKLNDINIENQEKAIVHKTKRDISDRLRFKILMRDWFTCKKCWASPLKAQDV